MGIIGGEQVVAFGLGYNPIVFLRDKTASIDGSLRLFGLQRTDAGKTIAIRDNGVAAASSAISPVNVSTGKPWRLGAFDTKVAAQSQQFMMGAIAEVVVIKGTIAPNDLTALESYLMTKWKLP